MKQLIQPVVELVVTDLAGTTGRGKLRVVLSLTDPLTRRTVSGTAAWGVAG